MDKVPPSDSLPRRAGLWMKARAGLFLGWGLVAALLFAAVAPLPEHLFVVLRRINGDDPRLAPVLIHLVLWGATLAAAFYAYRLRAPLGAALAARVEWLLAAGLGVLACRALVYHYPATPLALTLTDYERAALFLFVAGLCVHAGTILANLERRFGAALERLDAPAPADPVWRLWLLLPALLAGATVLFSTGKYGVGLSPDSCVYLSTAANLAAGRGWVLFTGEPYQSFPPLYPLLLAGFDWLGIGAEAGLRGFNAAAIGLLSYGVGRYLVRHVAPWRAFLGAMLVALLPVHQHVFSIAWSEVPFILTLWGAALLLLRYRENPTLARLFAAALAVALLPLTRYAGGFFLPVFVLFPLAYPAGLPLAARALRASVFAVLSLLPVGLWMLRNRLLGGHSAGVRYPARDGLGEQWHQMSEALSGGIFGQSSLLFGLLVLFALAGLAAQLWRRRTLRVDVHLLFPAGLVLAYLLILLVISGRIAFDPLDQRLISPAAVGLILLGVYALDRSTRTIFTNNLRPLGYLLGMALLGFWLVQAASASRTQVVWQAANGAHEIRTDAYYHSPLLEALERLDPQPAVIYTNHEFFVQQRFLESRSFATGPQVRGLVACHYRSKVPNGRYDRFVLDIRQHGQVWLALFDAQAGFGGDCALSLDTLLQVSRVAGTQTFGDGKLLHLIRHEPP